jgi:hypothetical protein
MKIRLQGRLITLSVEQHTSGLSHIVENQAVETPFSHNQPVLLLERRHNQPIVGLIDHNLVELVLVEHKPAGWLVH